MEAYDDFALKFEGSGRKGPLRVLLTEPFYGVEQTLGPLLASSELRHRLSGQYLRSLHLAGEEEPGPGARRVGGQLFEALIRGAIRDAWLESVQRAQATEGRGIRLRLLFDLQSPLQRDAFGLGWEALYRPDTGDFLGLDLRISIVRSVAARRPAPDLAPPSRLRLVVACASPQGLPALRLDLERQRLESLEARLPQLELCFTEEPTLQGLTRALDAGAEPPVLLFCGHGELSSELGGILCFEDHQGRPHRVPASALAECCKAEARPWLVVLNACQTAALSTEDWLGPHTGVASALVLSGLPAVIAMRSPISDQAAITLSHALFAALAEGELVEAALTRARRTVFAADPTTLEWYTPILTTRSGTRELRIATEARAMDRKRKGDETPPSSQVSNAISGFTFSHNQSAVGLNQGEIHQDFLSFHTHQGSDGVDPAAAAALVERFASELAAFPEAVRPEIATGLDLLAGGQHREAADAFGRARKKAGHLPRLGYYDALAEIRGRSLRDLDLGEAEDLQRLLGESQRQDPRFGPPAFLLAALKLQFYQSRGFLVKEPGPELLLTAFERADCSRQDVDRLLSQVSLDAGPLRERLERSAG